MSEVRRAIKAELGEAIPVAAGLIQLYTNSNRNQLITDLDDITPEANPQYYRKLRQGGFCVVIGTSPPPSGNVVGLGMTQLPHVLNLNNY